MGIASTPYELIFDALDEATSSGRYSTDGVLCAKIFAELGRSISVELDSEQIKALIGCRDANQSEAGR